MTKHIKDFPNPPARLASHPNSVTIPVSRGIHFLETSMRVEILRHVRAWVCGTLMLLAARLPAHAATPDEIQAAIKKGQDYLYARLGKDGTWEMAAHPELNSGTNPHINYKMRLWGGLTAMTSYALLASGENPQNPKLKPAIDFLAKANIQSTYGLGISSQVWLFVPPTAQTRDTVNHTEKMLELGMIRGGEANGLYTYYTGLKDGSTAPIWTNVTTGFTSQRGTAAAWDLSNSQYAILGMWALTESGAEVPADYWKRAQEIWEKMQDPDGGWRYDHAANRAVNPAMTAAGIATLFITQDFTQSDRWGVCTGAAPNPAIERGLAWMDQHIDKVVSTQDYYTLYGIERIGVASGHKYFGTTDWYDKGADFIVKKQNADGSWKSTTGANPTRGDTAKYKYADGTHVSSISDTCFAILFLSRGGAPIMMNKLEYESPKAEKGLIGIWNERPRDAANLARWSGHQIEHDLNWQVVNLKVPTAELHDAPILYMSGSQPLDFAKPDVDKLRAYIEEGGMILANADCRKNGFADSFVALGKKLFPQYEFRQLPPAHPIFTREQFKATRWRTRPIVSAMSNGVREMLLVLPDADAARAWQTRADRTQEQMFQLGADIFLYAVDKKNLQDKGETYILAADQKITGTKKLKIGRLIVGDNPDPEPGGWRRFSALLHNHDKIDLSTFAATPGEGTLALSGKMAHLTGTTAFTLSEGARVELKSFVQGGGTLIVDAAGGSTSFAASAENELRSIFGPDAKQLDNPLPANSEVYKTPGFSADAIQYRAFARDILLRSARQARLRGLTVNNRLRVFYSREDLSGGMVGQAVDGINGYEPESATQLMRAIILYSMGK